MGKCNHPDDAKRWRDATRLWAVSPESPAAVALCCNVCGADLPFGPARDTPETAIEVRAAELAAHKHDMQYRLSIRFKTNHAEVAGWRGDETIDALTVVDEHGHLRVDRDVPLNLDSPSWRAGFLARCIVQHDEQETP